MAEAKTKGMVALKAIEDLTDELYIRENFSCKVQKAGPKVGYPETQSGAFRDQIEVRAAANGHPCRY
jgi:hypothetical protein